jgi:predicted hydrolase (HD superfamily)
MGIKGLIEHIGYLSGNLIILGLPTLETDMLLSQVVIPVAEDKKREWERRESIYNYNSKDHTEFYDNLEWYKENIEKTHLKHLIEFSVIFKKEWLEYEEDFIRGYNLALWDSDYSHYTLVEIEKHKHWTSAILKTDYDKTR